MVYDSCRGVFRLSAVGGEVKRPKHWSGGDAVLRNDDAVKANMKNIVCIKEWLYAAHLTSTVNYRSDRFNAASDIHSIFYVAF